MVLTSGLRASSFPASDHPARQLASSEFNCHTDWPRSLASNPASYLEGSIGSGKMGSYGSIAEYVSRLFGLLSNTTGFRRGPELLVMLDLVGRYFGLVAEGH